MPKRDISRRIDELRRFAGSGDVGNFAARLHPLLRGDFPRWFRILREQKLANQFRNAGNIRELGRLLEGQLRSALAAPEIDALNHHFDVCEFLQEVFAYIDAETVALACRDAHPETFARAICRMIEMAHYAFHRNSIVDAESAPKRVTMLQLAHRERQFRDVLDTGNIILNSQIARQGTDTSHVFSNSDLNDLARLALRYDEMRQLLDLYSYGRAEIRIKRKSLVVGKTEHEGNLAAMVGSERTADHDNMRQILLMAIRLEIYKESRSIPVGADSFLDFLRKVDTSKAGAAARRFGQAFANDLEIEVSDFFELGAELTTESGVFKVGDLIRAWAFLFTIATLGQIWNEARAEVTLEDTAQSQIRKTGRRSATIRDVLVPELHRNWLIRILLREANLPRNQALGLVQQFTSRPRSRRIDLFYKPLLALPSGVVLLPTPYILGSRFERNLFALIATETELDQKKKGYLPVLNLVQEFRDAGFQALANFRVQVAHRELTDIDLVAFKDGILFLGQCKILIEPDSLYDAWKAEGKLRFAAEQLNTCVAHLDKVRRTLFERLGVEDSREHRIVMFILTNTRQFTERRFGGYPVIDLPYLRFVLAGARGSVILTGSDGIDLLPGRSFIKDERPSGDELAALLGRTIHNVQERTITYRHVMRKIGDRKLHVPLMSMGTPGESHFLFGKGDDFDREVANELRRATRE